MHNYLVRQSDNTVVGFSSKPLDFSISGLYIVDVDPVIFPLPDLVSNSVTDLLTAKRDAYQALTNLTSSFWSEEHITTKVDSTLSYQYISGIPKQTGLLPSGHIITNSFALGGSVTKLYCHWKVATYQIVQTSLDPAWVRYNWDGTKTVDFNPNLFTVELMAGASSEFTFTPNTLHTGLSISAGSYRLKFTNTSLTNKYILLDWYLFWDV